MTILLHSCFITLRTMTYSIFSRHPAFQCALMQRRALKIIRLGTTAQGGDDFIQKTPLLATFGPTLYSSCSIRFLEKRKRKNLFEIWCLSFDKWFVIMWLSIFCKMLRCPHKPEHNFCNICQKQLFATVFILTANMWINVMFWLTNMYRVLAFCITSWAS